MHLQYPSRKRAQALLTRPPNIVSFPIDMRESMTVHKQGQHLLDIQIVFVVAFDKVRGYLMEEYSWSSAVEKLSATYSIITPLRHSMGTNYVEITSVSQQMMKTRLLKMH